MLEVIEIPGLSEKQNHVFRIVAVIVVLVIAMQLIYRGIQGISFLFT